MTQKKQAEGKIPITISLKYSNNLDEFEAAAEKKFPELDLVQVGNFTSNYSDEYAQQLKNNDLTDIVLTWPLDKAARDCEDRLIDLSGKEFTSRYNISMLNSISQNGKLYYLPGPTPLRGILFNKTMFEENGWSVPSSFLEFISLCKTIEASGIRALQLSFWNKEVLRYAFMGFGYGDSFGTPSAAEKLQGYRLGSGSLGDFAIPAFESFERLVEEGVFKKEDLEVRYPIRERALYNRECAMVSDGTALIPAARKAGNNDEFAVMPFYCPGEMDSWGQLIPTQYIGLNKELEKPGNKKKYQLALQVLDYISTPEGQLALSGGNATMFSSLIGSAPQNVPEYQFMQKAIDGGRCTVFPTITFAGDALYEALAGILRGEMSREEAIAMVDSENSNPTPVNESPVIGSAAEEFTIMDTGSYVTDVMRFSTGADFALFLDNGKDGSYNARGITSKFYKGEIHESDVTDRVLPVLQHGEKGYMHKITISGESLRNALEYALEGGNWFYYFSGLKMDYDVTAAPGERIKKLTDDKGGQINPDSSYTVAIMEGAVADKYISSTEDTGILIKDLIIEDIKSRGTISPLRDGRFKF